MEHKHKKHHEKSNHKHQHKKKGRPAYGYMVKKAIPYILGAAIIIIAFGFLFKTGQTDQTDNGDTSKSGTSEVTFYVMSQCPYGTQVEDAIAPVLKEMGNSVDFRLEFIAGESGDGFAPNSSGSAQLFGIHLRTSQRGMAPRFGGGGSRATMGVSLGQGYFLRSGLGLGQSPSAR